MEKLTINIPDKKIALVKQVLQGLGINIPGAPAMPRKDYKKKISQVSVWSEEDIKVLEEGKNAFNSLKAEQW